MYKISEMLAFYVADKHLRASTCQSYGVASRALIRRFGDCLLEEIDRPAIIEWRNTVLDVTIKAISWNTYIRQLRVLYQYGLRKGKVGGSENPFDDIQVRCPNNPIKTIQQKTLLYCRGLLDIMQKQEDSWGEVSEFHPAWFWRTVFETLICTGIRANELLTLRLCDLDFPGAFLRIDAAISKNYNAREVPLHKRLEPLLKVLVLKARKHKAREHEQLFNVNLFSVRHQCKVMNMDQLSAFFKKLSAKAPQRISAHRLRHTIATEMMCEHERNIHTVKNILGHRNIATTLKYIRVNHGQMRNLINVSV